MNKNKKRCFSLTNELEITKGDIDCNELIIPDELEINLPSSLPSNNPRLIISKNKLKKNDLPINKLQLIKRKKSEKNKSLNQSNNSIFSLSNEEKVKIGDFLRSSIEKPRKTSKIISKETHFYINKDTESSNNENIEYEYRNNNKLIEKPTKYDEELYKDALKRIEKSRSFNQKKIDDEEEQINHKQKLFEKSKKNNIDFLQQKFFKEFLKIIKELEKKIGNTLIQIDYLLMCEILNKMGFLQYYSSFIDSDKHANPYFIQEKTNISKIWKILNGDQNNKIQLENLFRFLLCIIGIPIPKFRILDNLNENSIVWGASTLAQDLEIEIQNNKKNNSEEKNYFSIQTPYKNEKIIDESVFYKTIESKLAENNVLFDELYTFDRQSFEINETKNEKAINIDKYFNPTQIECKQIRLEFESFYANRLKTQIKPNENPIPHDYKPKILNNARILSKNYWQKIVENSLNSNSNKKTQLKHTDLLLLHKTNNELKIEKEINKRKETETSECTFCPKITSNYRSKSTMPDSSEKEQSFNKPYYINENNQSRKEYLKTLAQPKQKRIDKSTEDIEFDKNKKECTFNPIIISKKNAKDKRQNKEVEIKNQQKYVERMEAARIEREIKKNYKERGYIDKKNILKDIRNLSYNEVNTDFLQKFFKHKKRDISPKENDSKFYYTKMIEKDFNKITDKNLNKEKIEIIKNENNTPILILDINIDKNKNEKIEVFKNSNPNELAEIFSKKHSKTKQKLNICE